MEIDLTKPAQEIAEVWRDIPGYEGYYQASSIGRIRSVDRKTENKNRKGRVIRQRENTRKYLQVQISKNNNPKQHLAHRLIAITFIPNPENKPLVNHINGIKTDNRVENLEWVTSSENHKHAFYVLKNRIPTNRLTIDIYDGIIKDRKNGSTTKFLSEKYGYSKSRIIGIIAGRCIKTIIRDTNT